MEKLKYNEGYESKINTKNKPSVCDEYKELIK